MNGLELGGWREMGVLQKNDQTLASLHMRAAFGGLLIYILSGYVEAFRILLAFLIHLFIYLFLCTTLLLPLTPPLPHLLYVLIVISVSASEHTCLSTI